jgi:hypothetical protein
MRPPLAHTFVRGATLATGLYRNSHLDTWIQSGEFLLGISWILRVPAVAPYLRPLGFRRFSLLPRVLLCDLVWILRVPAVGPYLRLFGFLYTAILTWILSGEFLCCHTRLDIIR